MHDSALNNMTFDAASVGSEDLRCGNDARFVQGLRQPSTPENSVEKQQRPVRQRLPPWKVLVATVPYELRNFCAATRGVAVSLGVAGRCVAHRFRWIKTCHNLCKAEL
jgi:hypothetical protein